MMHLLRVVVFCVLSIFSSCGESETKETTPHAVIAPFTAYVQAQMDDFIAQSREEANLLHDNRLFSSMIRK